MTNTAKIAAQDKKCTVKKMTSNGIPVTIHIPNDVAETVKRQKINRIYDILSPNLPR